MALTPFATVDDLAAFWRPLNNATEIARATSLLTTTSSYLRQIAANNSVDLDVKIDDDTNDILTDSIKMVVLSAVKRAMLTPPDAPPADQWSQSANPYSETIKFTNPSSDLFFKASELQLLGLSSVAGRSKIGILRGVR